MITGSCNATISKGRTRTTHFIYDALLSKVYDRIQDHMIKLKKPAVEQLHLKPGDRVISFCCGTGQEFPFIQEKIGPEGRILGIDWSEGMLARAKRRSADNNWNNVTLIYGDVTALPEGTFENGEYDAAICTLGLSIIAEPATAFRALQSAVKSEGGIVIGDICSFSGAMALLNPLNALINAPFGNTWRSLAESRKFADALRAEFRDYSIEWHLGGCYYIVAGRK